MAWKAHLRKAVGRGRVAAWAGCEVKPWLCLPHPCDPGFLIWDMGHQQCEGSTAAVQSVLASLFS